RVVEIFAVGNFMRAQRIDQHVALVLVGERIALDFNAGGQSLDADGNRRGDVLLQAFVHKIQGRADGHGGYGDANEKPHLLIDYLLPVRPIEVYEDRLDEQYLPVPLVPAQDIGPWLQALRRLLNDRAHYEQVSAESREAALTYV